MGSGVYLFLGIDCLCSVGFLIQGVFNTIELEQARRPYGDGESAALVPPRGAPRGRILRHLFDISLPCFVCGRGCVWCVLWLSSSWRGAVECIWSVRITVRCRRNDGVLSNALWSSETKIGDVFTSRLLLVSLCRVKDSASSHGWGAFVYIICSPIGSWGPVVSQELGCPHRF